jgi:hypothetical protein
MRSQRSTIEYDECNLQVFLAFAVEEPECNDLHEQETQDCIEAAQHASQPAAQNVADEFPREVTEKECELHDYACIAELVKSDTSEAAPVAGALTSSEMHDWRSFSLVI